MKRAVSRGAMDLLCWSIFAIGGIYGGGWVLVLSATKNGENAWWESWILPFESLYLIHSLAAIILAASIMLGWIIVSPRLLSIVNPAGNYEKRIYLAAWLLLIAGVAAQWVYVQVYGGFFGLLDYSSAIRSAIFEESNPYGFLEPFGRLVVISSFLFFGLFISGYRKFGLKVGLLGALAFSVYVLVGRQGRIESAIYVASFLLATALFRGTRPIVLILWAGSILLVIPVSAWFYTMAFQDGGSNGLTAFLAREFSFPFASFFAQLDLGAHLYRGFVDFFVAPVYMLPSSWWRSWVGEISATNTTVLLGAPKGEQGVTGGIPTDLLTLGLMQLSILGVAAVGAMFGGLLRCTQAALLVIRNGGIRAILEAYIALKIAIIGMFYSQPALFIAGNFDLWFGIAVMLFCLWLPKIRAR